MLAIHSFTVGLFFSALKQTPSFFSSSDHTSSFFFLLPPYPRFPSSLAFFLPPSLFLHTHSFIYLLHFLSLIILNLTPLHHVDLLHLPSLSHVLTCSAGPRHCILLLLHTHAHATNFIKKWGKKSTLTQSFHVIVKLLALLHVPRATESLDHVCSGAEK